MSTLLQDLRYALRQLRRNPAFTVVAVVTLALGIGGNTAVFSLVHAVLLSPLPYPDAERVVALWGSRGTDRQILAAYTDVMEWRSENHSFEEIGVIRGQSVNLTGTETPDRLSGEFVTAETFAVLGARPARGRLFTAEETRPENQADVVVLSDQAWQTRFGGDPNILGRTLVLNGRPSVVIGVLSPGYQSPFGAMDVWLPISAIPNRATFERGNPNVWAIGRLKPAVTPDQAQRDLSAIASRLSAEYPATNAGRGATVIPLREQIAGEIKPVLLTVLAAVALVLLIACANVANLQLARAAARRHEISLRAALGAGRTRLLRQLLTESLLLSIIGGACGVLLASFAVGALAGAVPGGLPTFGPVGVDRSVLLFSTALTIAAGVIFGLAPAWYASRANLNDALKLRAQGGGGAVARFDLRSALVVVELSLCIVLLIGAGLLIRSIDRLAQVRPGFEPAHLLTFQFRLPSVKYHEPEQIAAFFTQALDEVRRVPGVKSAALVSATPFSGNWGSTAYQAEGRPVPEPGKESVAGQYTVSDGYFQTMGIPLIAGREFDPRDRLGSLPVAIVNQELARREWPTESPIGRRVQQAGDSTWLTVVAVVGNAKQLTLGEEPTPQLYRPVLQAPGIFSNIVARTAGEPVALALAVRAAIWVVDRDQPVWKISSMEQLLSRSTAPLHFTMLLTALFAVVALVLGAVGVYGVMSYAVVQRTREMGIRIAIGARPSQVMALMLGRGVRVTAVATGLGLLVSFAATRLLASQLFGIGPTDLVTYAAVTVLLGGVALFACWLPARRAAQVDPMVAMRSE